VTALRDGFCAKPWICAKGLLLSNSEKGISPLCIIYLNALKFYLLSQFETRFTLLDARLVCEQVSRLSRESVLPAVLVVLTAFCTVGRKRGQIWKSLRRDALVRIVWC